MDSQKLENKPEILYIMGCGRSGSTILEVLLTNNEGLAGVGEVTHIFRDGFIADTDCACGESTAQCAMWSAVRRGTDWRDREVRSAAELFNRVESHRAFFFSFCSIIGADIRKKYSEINELLFRTVGQVTGSNVVVDSSKYAGRALALSKVFPEKIRVICLTRSPAGILHAFQKQHKFEQKPKSTFATLVYYLYVMLCCRIVMSSLGKRAYLLKYEDLTRDPVSALKGIQEWSGYDLGQVQDLIKTEKELSVGHIVTGNRLRKLGKVKFRISSSVPALRGFWPPVAEKIMTIAVKLMRF